MSVRRKLFLTMASFIAAMGIVFILLTMFIVWGIINAMIDVDRSKEMAALSSRFEEYYRQNSDSWEGVRQFDIGEGWSNNQDAQVLLMSLNGNPLYMSKMQHIRFYTRLGMHTKVQVDGETVANLYYYDREVGNIAKMKYGISSSVTFFLIVFSIIFILISLFVAYRLSKRMTAPLSQLIPAIDRLGRGEFGVQVPIQSEDEYGKMAHAFNTMSTQIQRAEALRRSLVADVAHELRTPITIIRGKLDLVQQSGHSIEPESLLPLQDELIRLTRLVDDLHLLSLAEAKKLPIERVITPFLPLLQRVVDHLAGDARDKGIEIRMRSLHLNETGTAYIDPNRITQVFLNLLINAIRYTPEGGTVTITVGEAAAHSASHGMMRITVADTGIGIDPEHLPHLFDRFFRTDDARTRNGGGMGLGLAIAKEFILAQGGSIDVESAPGQGTTFIVRLPTVYQDSF